MKHTARILLGFALLAVSQAFASPFLLKSSLRTFSRGVPTALNMKTIAVFGASGLTASECIYQALQDGDKIVGLTRNPDKLKVPKGSGGEKADQPLTDEKLTVIAGDVTKKDDVDKVFAENSIDSVIVALGGKTSDVGATMLTDGTKNIIDAMKEKGVKRLAVVSAIGVGDSYDKAPFYFRILISTVMSKIFKDKNNQEELIRSSDLDYVIIRPGGLTVDPPTGVVNIMDGTGGNMARADVAKFCLDAARMDDFPYIKQSPCISSVSGTSWIKDRSKAARGEM